MGAETFKVVGEGPTADDAFWRVVEQACWDHGNDGYTGTIAEKDKFVMMEVPVGANNLEFVDDLEQANAFPFDDKWGPAGCVPLTEGRWLFFGSASS